MTKEELQQVPNGTKLLCTSHSNLWSTVTGLLSEVIHNGNGGYGVHIYDNKGERHRCWLCYYTITLAPQ